MAFTKVVGAGIHTLSNITSHNINSSGIITATKFVGPIEGDITAVDATFTGNVSIAKTLTYEDVANVDSVGIVTARQGIEIPNDTYKLRTGTELEMQVWHDGTNSVIKDTRDSGKVRIQADNFDIRDKDDSQTMIAAGVDGSVSLSHSGNQKIQTTSHGISVTGIGTFSDSVLIDTTVTTEASADGNDLIIGSTSDTQKGISIVGSTTNGVGNIFFTDGASYKNQGIIQYRHADDSMRFTTAQYEALRILSDGKVGIGTVNPTSLLTVGARPKVTSAAATVLISPPSGDASIQLRGGSPTFEFDGTGGGNGRIFTDSADLAISSGTLDGAGTEMVRIKSSTGAVGIGTNAYGNIDPLAPLHVSSYSATTTITTFNHLRDASQILCQTSNNVNNSRSGITFTGALHSTDGCSAGIIANHENVAENNETTSLSFYTSHNEVLGERLHISSDGKVGIGTDNPGALLTVYGSPAELRLQHTGNGSYSRLISDSSNELKIYTGGGPHLGMIIDGSQNVGIGTDNPVEKLSVEDSSPAILINATSATGESKLQFGRIGNTNVGEIKYEHNNNAFTFRTNDTANRLCITSAGDVGIGITNPGQKLHVEGGSIRIRGTGSNETNGQVDFGDDYRILKYTDQNTMTLQSPKSVVINIDNNNNNTDAYFQIKKDTTDPETGGTELFRVQEDGNVGINEASPDAPLHITGGLPHIRFENSGTSASANDIFGQIDFKHNDSSDAGVTAAIKCVAEDANGNSFLAFYNGDGGDADERLRLTSTGNVNIGGNYTQGTYRAQIMTGANKFISFTNAAHDEFTDEASAIIFSRQSDGAKELSGIFEHSNTSFGIATRNHLTLHAGGTSTYSASPERMRITSGGNLRLGLNSVAEQTDSAHYIMTLTGKSGQTGAGAIAFKDPSANTDGFIFADGGNLFITADYSNATADSSIRFRVDGSTERLRIYERQTYGVDNYADTGTGQRDSNQEYPLGVFEWNNDTDSGIEKYNCYIQATGANETDMYITIRNSGFYRITIKASHNSTQADVAQYLIYGLNSHVSGNKITQVVSSGSFTVTNHNTHVNTYSSTVKISYGTSCNQGLRALVEVIGGF